MRETTRSSSRSTHLDLSLERARRLIEFEGARGLGDDQLLAVLLGRGGDELSPLGFSHSLLEQTGGLSRLALCHVASLKRYSSLGMAQATRLVAAFELGRRAVRDASRLPPRDVVSKESITRWAEPRLAGLEHEEVWITCVDAQSIAKSTWQVGRGGIHGCGLLARDILTPVVRDAASGFVLIHNHPSGDPTPSVEDIELTRGLVAAATAVCVPLLDHIIVARGGSQSLFELGLL